MTHIQTRTLGAVKVEKQQLLMHYSLSYISSFVFVVISIIMKTVIFISMPAEAFLQSVPQQTEKVKTSKDEILIALKLNMMFIV